MNCLFSQVMPFYWQANISHIQAFYIFFPVLPSYPRLLFPIQILIFKGRLLHVRLSLITSAQSDLSLWNTKCGT